MNDQGYQAALRQAITQHRAEEMVRLQTERDAARREVERLKAIVWGLVPGDDLDRGGCWCREWRSPLHEPECERVRAWFAEHGAPPMRRDVGQVGTSERQP